MNGLVMFALGAACSAAASAISVTYMEQLKSVAPDRLVYASAPPTPGRAPNCARFFFDEVHPGGLVTTRAQAELIFRSALPDPRLVRTQLRIADGGDHWVLRQEPPPGWKGGGYNVHIGKCDGAITLIDIAQ